MQPSVHSKARNWRYVAQIALFAVAALLASGVWMSANDIEINFIALGLVGAIFANATGAGGGVVFIPTFQQMGLSESASVATSFGIQTFGMTAGALAWLLKFSDQKVVGSGSLKLIMLICAITIVPTVLGLYSVRLLNWPTPARFDLFFSWFSIVLGLAIVASLLKFSRAPMGRQLTNVDVVMLLLLAYFGGIVTAWLSVGVGEIIAFYLIARGFNPSLAIASAVVITALSVWSIAPYTFAIESSVAINIVIAAGPAAFVGGLTARFLVDRLPQFWLKLFFGSWLILVGLLS